MPPTPLILETMPPTPLIFLEISLSLSRRDKTLRAGRDNVSDGNKGGVEVEEEVEVAEKAEKVENAAGESPPQETKGENEAKASKHSERTQKLQG